MLSTRDPGRLRPFPWASLDSTTKDQADALRNVRRWASGYVNLETVATAMADLIGATVEVHVRCLQLVSKASALDPGIGLLVARIDDRPARVALLEAEPALAAAIVARAIRRTPPALVGTTVGASPSVAGAFAAVVMAAVRRARGPAIRVIAAGPTSVLEMDMARPDTRLVSVGLTVLIDNDAFTARVVMVEQAAAGTAPPTWNAGRLRELGVTPLSLPIVACAVVATVAEVAALQPGDVFLPGGWHLSRCHEGDWTGRVLLASPCAQIGIAVQLGEGALGVLSGEPETVCAAEAEMAEGSERNALIDAIGEVPVVVRVEIGEAVMAAREWAALGRGDVIALGRRVGEKVVLRVGGVPVARGELVEIEGEVGVRIAERIAH